MEKEETEKQSNLKNVVVITLKVLTCTAAAAAGTILGNIVYNKMKS